MTKIINPVLKGFHPDPCLCKAEDKYYLITSTFEWVPGITIHESNDLLNWTLKGGLLDKLELVGIPDSAGIWAPALTYDQGTFYLIFTISKQIDGYFKDVENYVTTATSIDGPWSEPILMNASGFDPSMFHENGKHYILNPQWDSRPLDGHKKFNGLILQEFSFENGMVGESKVVFKGSETGGTEGPHLIKKDGYYYIIAAEGGTGRHHSIVVARSQNIWGPYVISPYHPLITAWEKETILKKSGHGNFVKTDDGEWYMTHLCARYLDNKDVCVLGRETAMQKIEWVDDWPRMVQHDNTPLLEVEAPIGTSQIDKSDKYSTNFQNIDLIKDGWLSLRTGFHQKVKLSEDGLIMKGNDSLTSLFHQSLIARRWTSFDFEAETCLEFLPYHYSQTAGLTCYYNTKVFHYLYVGYDEKTRQRVISILSNDNQQFIEPLQGNYIYIPEGIKEVYLKVIVHQDELQFLYSFDGVNYNPIGPILDASILSDEHAQGWAYTGAVVGLTAVDNFNKGIYAKFTLFKQINK
ncbi:MAG: glycoside hydrolase family 43 protein [Coprobacillus sp.]